MMDLLLKYQPDSGFVYDILNKVSSHKKTVDEGEALFIDLKLNLCSSAAMEGDEEDNRLAYIYCAKDISHLLG